MSMPAAKESIEVCERSILDLQAALAADICSSQDLVDAYLRRIAAYDQQGPAINAIVTINRHARAQAADLDSERRRSGPRGPLHGIPILIKDNFNTADMSTSGGTLALANMQPTEDAFLVRRLKQAGAIILGKTTLHELAAGVTNVSSLTGVTRNPYAPGHIPGGSSGGTAAAVAASFAAAGMGTDTSGSIRVPAACQNLVGLRTTFGLSSRDGIIPLCPSQDIGGPLARTIYDLAIMLDATVGSDTRDPATRTADRHIPASYLAGLHTNALSGARIGILRSLFGTQAYEEETTDIVLQALDAMRILGATLVEVSVDDIECMMHNSSLIAHEFKFALAQYLARQTDAPVRSLKEILDLGLHHEQLDQILRLRDQPVHPETPAYAAARQLRTVLRRQVLRCMTHNRLDVLAYPVLRCGPVKIGEQQPAQNCSLSPATGLPAMAMPAGFTKAGTPVGLELLGKAYSEQALLNYAFHWEQSGQRRMPPRSTQPLSCAALATP